MPKALGLVPITTPAYSLESHGFAEAFAHTFTRDYVRIAELRDAETVLAQLGSWVRRPRSPGAPSGARNEGRSAGRAQNSCPPLSSDMGSKPSESGNGRTEE